MKIKGETKVVKVEMTVIKEFIVPKDISDKASWEICSYLGESGQLKNIRYADIQPESMVVLEKNDIKPCGNIGCSMGFFATNDLNLEPTNCAAHPFAELHTCAGYIPAK